MSEERSVMILVAYPAGVQEPLRASKGARDKRTRVESRVESRVYICFQLLLGLVVGVG